MNPWNSCLGVLGQISDGRPLCPNKDFRRCLESAPTTGSRLDVSDPCLLFEMIPGAAVVVEPLISLPGCAAGWDKITSPDCFQKPTFPHLSGPVDYSSASMLFSLHPSRQASHLADAIP